MEAVPLFPLPNVVLFPNALLPLHIFEERYKAMTADALAGRRQIAMALLSPGWEKAYCGKPNIESVVCVGRIVDHQRLKDGRHNLLLRGERRAVVASEYAAHPQHGRLYRLARLLPLPESPAMEIDLSHERSRLAELLSEKWLADVPLIAQIRTLLRGPTRTADIADLIAFHLMDDVQLKQSLLADGDVRRRVQRLLAALGSLETLLAQQASSDAATSDPLRN